MTFSSGAPLHFETGSYQKQSVFLPDEEYGRALDTLVKVILRLSLICGVFFV